jgi:arabinogalactan endo-1,4-beta-galactosidase
LDDHDGYPNIVGPSTDLPVEYPPVPEGQALFIRDLLSLVARTPDNLGRGIVYWEPAWIPGVGWEPGAGNNWDNQTLFDPHGRALMSLDAAQIRDQGSGIRDRTAGRRRPRPPTPEAEGS